MNTAIYVKVLKNKKVPFEKDWQNNPVSKTDIQSWIKSGGNRGILYSKITGLCCIDIDNPDKFPLPSLIQNPDTTAVKTRKGFHLIYQRPDGLQNSKFEWGDFLYENKQGLIPPSVVDGKKRIWVKGGKPQKMSAKLLMLLQLSGSELPDIKQQPINYASKFSELTKDNHNRNNTLIHITGIIRNKVKPQYLADIVQLFNSYMPDPLPSKDIIAMCKQANKYIISDDAKAIDAAYQILVDPMRVQDLHRIMQQEGFNVSYRQLTRYIKRLVDEKKVFKQGRGVYRSTKPTKIANITSIDVNLGKPVPYEIPLHITDISDIYPNDVLMLASKAGFGKTHVFAYIIRRLLEQDISCVYWDMENDLANIVHIFNKYIPKDLLDKNLIKINTEDVAIESLELDPKAVNFIDPIYVEDGWGEVDNMMRRMKKQLDGGLCFMATHIKDIDGRVFGGATALKVPSFAFELKHNKEDRFKPEFKTIKVRNWKPGCKINKIKCVWDDDRGLSEL